MDLQSIGNPLKTIRNYDHGNVLFLDNWTSTSKIEKSVDERTLWWVHVIMGKFVGGMRLYIPINRVGGERGAQSFAINSWSFAIRAATVPNRAEKYYRGWRVVIYSATLYYREWYVLSGLSSLSRFSSFSLTSLVWSIIAFFFF